VTGIGSAADVRCPLWFIYTKRGTRIDLPTATAVRMESETAAFLDASGVVVARLANEEIWIHADHELAADYQAHETDSAEPSDV
jgi:hypothetical protein